MLGKNINTSNKISDNEINNKRDASSDVIDNQSIVADQQKNIMHINEKKEFYENLIIFLEDSEKNDDDLQNLFDIFNLLNEENEDTKNKIENFIQLITNIANNHHQDENFFTKIFKIIQKIKDTIMQYFSNIEIYKIFQDNKKILLFLLQNQIIIIDDIIYHNIVSKKEPNGNRYCYFFYQEIKEFNTFDKDEKIKKELLLFDSNIFDRFDEKREEGENDTYICSLIRKDLVEDFISFVNRANIPLMSTVKCSIFETNSFLNENNPTLIEYSAFFGSIQIFQYLRMNKVDMNPSIWLYAIHSDNPEIIHLLESLNIKPPSDKYEMCFIESIKCHHIAFSNYFENVFLNHDDIYNSQEIIKNIFQYHNYVNFSFNIKNEDILYYSCIYNYKDLVNLFIEKNEENIKLIIKEKVFIYLFFIISH